MERQLIEGEILKTAALITSMKMYNFLPPKPVDMNNVLYPLSHSPPGHRSSYPLLLSCVRY